MEVDGGRAAVAAAEEMGHTFLELAPGEIEKWQEAAKPIHDDWIQRAEAIGKPGRALYDEILRLVKEYS